MVVSSSLIAFKKVAHCNDGENLVHIAKLKRKVKPQNPKTKNLRVVLCLHIQLFLENNRGFLFHQMRFSDKEPHVFNSKYFQFLFKELPFSNSKKFGFFSKNLACFLRVGQRQMVLTSIQSHFFI